jgi:hypothetical protein
MSSERYDIRLAFTREDKEASPSGLLHQLDE